MRLQLRTLSGIPGRDVKNRDLTSGEILWALWVVAVMGFCYFWWG